MGVHTNFIHTTVKVFVDYYTRFLLFKSFAQRATQEDNSIQVKTVQGDVAWTVGIRIMQLKSLSRIKFNYSSVLDGGLYLNG